MISNEREGRLSFATLMVCMRVGHSNTGLLAVTRDVATRFGSTVIGIAAKQVSTHATQIRGAGLCEPQQHGLRKFAEHAGGRRGVPQARWPAWTSSNGGRR